MFYCIAFYYAAPVLTEQTIRAATTLEVDNPPLHGFPGPTSATTITTDGVHNMGPHLPDSPPDPDSANGHTKLEEKAAESTRGSGQRFHGYADKLDQEPASEAFVVNNSVPSSESVVAGAAEESTAEESPGKETSSGEPNTSSDMDKVEEETKEKINKKRQNAEVGFLSDSSGEVTSGSLNQTFQDSPVSLANYPMFPPTPISDTTSGMRPRPRRLSSMFEDIRPMSLTSSPMESPLLHSKHKSALRSKEAYNTQ